MLRDAGFFNCQNVVDQCLAVACLQMFKITNKVDIPRRRIISMTDNTDFDIFRVQCIQCGNQIGNTDPIFCRHGRSDQKQDIGVAINHLQGNGLCVGMAGRYIDVKPAIGKQGCDMFVVFFFDGGCRRQKKTRVTSFHFGEFGQTARKLRRRHVTSLETALCHTIRQSGPAQISCTAPPVSLSKPWLTSLAIKTLLPACHCKRIDTNHMTMPTQDKEIKNNPGKDIPPPKGILQA